MRLPNRCRVDRWFTVRARRDGWTGEYDDQAIEYLTYAILAYDAALVMLSDTQPVLFPRSLCRGERTARTRKKRKRKR